MDRVILHCDVNNFYASVEMKLNPLYKGKAIAVCGSQEDRKGIVLAKSEIAKKAGVKTGDIIFEAKKKCPDIIILPPNFEEYQKYSRLAQEIYYEYTDLIEPFGLDECWIDVTKSVKIFGSGEEIANEIREKVKERLGITISVGVSFNKIFAKLGSDMKKPDATTVILRENFKEKIFHLNANELIGIGRATYDKMLSYNIKTIGDLANASEHFMVKTFGKNGYDLYNYANGNDVSNVGKYKDYTPLKSVSNGITCNRDLLSNDEVYKVLLKLSQDVGKRLRNQEQYATRVQLSVKDTSLVTKQYQAPLKYASQSFNELTEVAFKLFEKNYKWKNPVRALSISAIDLTMNKSEMQIDIFESVQKSDKKLEIERAMDKIRAKYGKDSIEVASLTQDIKIEKNKSEVKVLPSGMQK